MLFKIWKTNIFKIFTFSFFLQWFQTNCSNKNIGEIRLLFKPNNSANKRQSFYFVTFWWKTLEHKRTQNKGCKSNVSTERKKNFGNKLLMTKFCWLAELMLACSPKLLWEWEVFRDETFFSNLDDFLFMKAVKESMLFWKDMLQLHVDGREKKEVRNTVEKKGSKTQTLMAWLMRSKKMPDSNINRLGESKKKKKTKFWEKQFGLDLKMRRKNQPFRCEKEFSLGKVTRKMTWKCACSIENFFTFWC